MHFAALPQPTREQPIYLTRTVPPLPHRVMAPFSLSLIPHQDETTPWLEMFDPIPLKRYVDPGEALVPYRVPGPEGGILEETSADIIRSLECLKQFQVNSRTELLLRDPEEVVTRKQAAISKRERRAIRALQLNIAGLEYETAAAVAGQPIKARYVVPCRVDAPPCVAEQGSAATEYYGIAKRALPEMGPDGVPTDLLGMMKRASVSLANHLANFAVASLEVKDTLLASDTLPKSWGKKRQEDVLRSTSVRGNVARSARKMKVKPNESLKTRKPRLIVANPEEITAAQCAVIKLIEEALFNHPVFESRSIKHTAIDGLNKRMCRLMKRFKAGGAALSVDFGSWDGTIRKALRDACENAIIDAFVIASGLTTDLSEVSVRDRLKSTLNLEGLFWDARSSLFGRESGDRGTSVLNYLTNFIACLTLEAWLDEKDTVDVQAALKARHNETSALDNIHEGDDTLLLFAAALIQHHGGKGPLFAKVLRFYRALKLNLEPAARGDVVSYVADEVMLPPGDRVELVSRYFIYIADTGFVTSVPKIPKFLASLKVTFSRGPIAEVGASAMLAACSNTTSCPLLFGLSKCLYNIWKAKGDMQAPEIRGHNYTERLLMLDYEESGAESYETWIANRRIASRWMDDEVRTFLAREYKLLTLDKQIQMETSLQDSAELAKRNSDLAWSKVGDVIAELENCVAGGPGL